MPNGSGNAVRQGFNDRLSGVTPVSPKDVPFTFATLPVTPVNGQHFYCSDCQATNPCTSGGTGSPVVGVNGAWSCSNGGSSIPVPVSATNGGTGTANPAIHTIAIPQGSAAWHFITCVAGLPLIGVTGVDPACSALDLSGTGVTNTLPVAKGGTGTTTPSLTAGTNITSITGVWPNQTINAANQGANQPAYGYHTVTNPTSPVTPTCDVNVQNTVYSYSLAANLTVNLSNTSCAAGQNLIFVYKQTAAGVVITYTMTTATMVWQANGGLQPTLSGNGATDWFEFTYDSRSTAFYETAQAPQVVAAKIYDIGLGFAGTIAASASDSRTLGRAVNWPANFAGSQASCGTNPTGAMTFTILDNGVQIGTLALTTACVETLTTTGGTAKSGALGDRISLVGPATPDTTAADVELTLDGTLP